MTTQTPAIFTQQLPGFLANRSRDEVARMNDIAASGTGGTGTSVNKISLKQSRFRLVVGGEEVKVIADPFLDVIIVRANEGLNKAFYLKAYQPGQDPESPDCYSEDGVRPNPQSKNKQCDTCAACPQNQWGSKINPQTGAKIKACADSKRVAILPPSNTAGDMYQLAIPAASMKDFGALLRLLNTAQTPVPYNAVVTRVEFDTDATYPKLKFSPVRYLTDEQYAAVMERYDSEEALIVCGAGTAGLPAAAAAAAAPVQAAPTQVKPSPQDDPFAGSSAASPAPAAAKPATRTRARATPAAAAQPAAAQPAADPFAAAPAPAPAQAQPQGATIDGNTGAVVSDDIDDVFGGGWDN